MFHKLTSLFNVLQKRGIYDKSFIVVCADHGSEYSQQHHLGNPSIPNYAFPFLWVKPIGATNPFSYSDIPTSHSKIHNLLCEALQKDLSAKDVDNILRSEKRLYRELRGNTLCDWTLGPSNDVTYLEHINGNANSNDKK